MFPECEFASITEGIRYGLEYRMAVLELGSHLRLGFRLHHWFHIRFGKKFFADMAPKHF
jgi:hypothetical protein